MNAIEYVSYSMVVIPESENFSTLLRDLRAHLDKAKTSFILDIT